MLLKKLTIVGIAALGLSGLTQAAEVELAAADGAQTNAITQDYTITAGNFVVTEFEYTVSANVALNTIEDTVAFAVGAASLKGRTPYTGSSNGGSVSVCGEPTTGAAVPAAPAPSLADTAVSGCLTAPVGA